MEIPQKWVYPINIITFNLSRLSPFRSKRIWIFGAWAGKKYDDNSRYLFEYIANSQTGKIRTVWLTRSPMVVDLVRNLGHEAYLGYSLKGLWLQLRAGLVFYTNSLNDFCLIPLVGGAEIGTSWHGMSFKKIYNSKYHGWKLIAKKLLDHIYSRTYRTLSFVPSEQGRRWFEESFTLNPDKIFITGQPRNDILKQVSKQDVLKKMGLDSQKKIILYLPTYRHAALGKDAMLRIVKGLYDDEEFNNMLKANNFLFLVKPHPVTPPLYLSDNDNFKVLTYHAVSNNQELLACGDILITDYSGGFIDFALLDRPIVFYTPDEEKFLADSEDIDSKFFDISKLNCAKTPHELAIKLANPLTVACDATNEVWEDRSIKGSCYSENVFNVLTSAVGLNR